MANRLLRFRMVKVVAEKELLDSIRNRWVHLFSLLFFLLTFYFAYEGILQPDRTGFQHFNRTTASMLNLVLFIIPMISLLLGALSIPGEREQGTLSLLLSKPVRPEEILLGKYLGLASALIVTLLFGFGLVGVLISLKVTVAEAKAYFIFLLLSLLLTLSFLSIALFLSTWVEKRITAMMGAVLTWFSVIMIYESLIMGISGFLRGSSLTAFLLAGILLNPAESVRILAILYLGGESLFGPNLVDVTRKLSSFSYEVWLFVSIFLWILLPLAAAVLRMRRKVKV